MFLEYDAFVWSQTIILEFIFYFSNHQIGPGFQAFHTSFSHTALEALNEHALSETFAFNLHREKYD